MKNRTLNTDTRHTSDPQAANAEVLKAMTAALKATIDPGSCADPTHDLAAITFGAGAVTGST